MKRELLRLAGGLLFVLVLNGAYTVAAACDGDYQPWLPPQVPANITCTAC